MTSSCARGRPATISVMFRSTRRSYDCGESSVKALLFSFDYPPHHGGIARLCNEIATNLARSSIPVTILTEEAHTAITPPPTEVRVHRRRPQREFEAWRWLRRLRPGAVTICGTWYPEGFLACLARMRPLVILAHGLELMPARAVWRRRVWKTLLRRVCEHADLIVANSNYTRQLVLLGAPNSKVVAMPLGVDHERFSPKGRDRARQKFDCRDKLLLSTVSRLHPYKGHDTVLRALARLPSVLRERFIYMIAGMGPQEEGLKAEARRLGLSSSVYWLGFVSEEELPDVYRASDLSLLCSREDSHRQEVEGFGLVCLEAQSCGTPVIGTRTGGIPDAIHHGEGGWLIQQDDTQALAKILSDLARDPAHFAAAGLAARCRISRECTWSHYIQRFTELLKTEVLRNE